MVPSREPTRLDAAIDELRTLFLDMMDPDTAETYRVKWFPRAEDE